MALTQPDRVFVQRLKELDPKLGCKFVPEHEHFVITYARPIGEPVNVLLIKNDDGSFRQPDDRDIRALQAADTHRVPMKERLKAVAKYMEDDRAERKRKRKQEIRDITKDNKLQFARRAAKIDSAFGAGNYSPFRPIEPKPRGITIK